MKSLENFSNDKLAAKEIHVSTVYDANIETNSWFETPMNKTKRKKRIIWNGIENLRIEMVKNGIGKRELREIKMKIKMKTQIRWGN